MYDQGSQLQAKGIVAAALGNDSDSIDGLSRYTGVCIVYLTAEHMYSSSGECNKRLNLVQQLADDGELA